MHVLVASSGSTVLENALLDAGHQVSLLVPTGQVDARRVDTPRATTVLGIDRWHDPASLAQVLATIPDGVFDRVATTDEQAVVTCARVREHLGLPGIGVEAALAHTDKHVAKTVLEEAGVPVARHRVVRHGRQVAAVAEEFGWPVVVKPCRAAGTVNTTVVRSRTDLDELLADGFFDATVDDPTGRFGAGEFTVSLHQAKGFMVEEFVAPTEEWFCDVYLHDGEVLAAFPGRYSAPLLSTLGGHHHISLVPPSHPDAAKVIKVASDACRALGSGTGVVHCEVMRTERGWVFGEGGHRPGGGGVTALYARQHGVDVPTVLAQLALGQRPDIPVDPDAGVLSHLWLHPPKGVVTHVASAEQLYDLAGVVEVDINLRVGEPVPTGFGTMSLAGRIAFASATLETASLDAARLAHALGLRVTSRTAGQIEGCVR
ncbi:ATP-grasp domain-containing protein [Streptacidiphilus jiangxiensis]|uniref:Carbamoyl-phosphate synthase L chain, ATP binding domain n=1 Tax=Streptacidiphilus jiangxiensis TaxID=235985 RepID=A0A1H8A8R1_STRJI|nr:hypothetical protein [Streptacidiphilus jiangxiensis]SEM65927.1 Carbamoyl-phosphate synthase L chain, ATP binding domain [Streptacidiphilus jiangxiensis]